MKKFLAILMILCISSVTAVYGEEVVFVTEEAEVLTEEISQEVIPECATESVAHPEDTEEYEAEYEEECEIELYEQDRIYNIKNVFEMHFPSTASTEMLNAGNGNVMNTWYSEGFTRRIAISNKNENLYYGAAPAPDKEDDMALRAYSPSTLTSNISDNYLEPYLVGVNPQYTGATDGNSWVLMSTGDNGYAEFSFDFYTDGVTNTDIRIGRYICADDNGSLSQVNEQAFWSLATDGTMKVRGKAIANFSASEIKNKWHTM